MSGWNPWAALRALPHVIFKLDDVAKVGGGGLWIRTHEFEVIALDPELTRTERNAALGHEIVHSERGIGQGEATPATMQLEEERVRRITAERLVPDAQLDGFIRQQLDVEGCVLAVDVAEHFEVPLKVAVTSLERAKRRWAA